MTPLLPQICPDEWLDESPNRSRPSRSAVSAAQPATPGGCGMGLTTYLVVCGSPQASTMWSLPPAPVSPGSTR